MTGEAPTGDVIVYETSEGDVRVDVRLDRDTAWLSQRQVAELFGSTPENVRNVFSDRELEGPATPKDFLGVQFKGRRHLRRQR